MPLRGGGDTGGDGGCRLYNGQCCCPARSRKPLRNGWGMGDAGETAADILQTPRKRSLRFKQ